MRIPKVEKTIALVVMLIYAAGLAIAQEKESREARDPEFENRLLERLREINVEAVPYFEEATQAYDAEAYETARNLFNRVLQLAPDFAAAERRLAYAEIMLDNADSGLVHARRALAIDSSGYNRAAVAFALLVKGDTAAYQDALKYALLALDSMPENVFVLEVLLQAGVMTGNESAVDFASSKLVTLAPDMYMPHYIRGILLAQRESWEESERELTRARELGMDSASVEEVLGMGVRARARIARVKRWGLLATGVWATSLALLFLCGAILSRLTLSAVARTQSTGAFQINGLERVIRTLYRIVIGITSAYYYVSVPFLLIIVAAAAAGFIYFWFQIGQIPVKLVLFVALGALFTLYAIVRSLFARAASGNPGRPLSREEAPKLWDVTDAVAAKVKTRPIQDIFIVPGADIAVLERGRIWQKLRGGGRRCLILGLAAIPGLTLGPFKSILAHEYGHFSHRDTAGGNLAHQTNRSLHTMAINLISGGLAKWYNPAWWFVRGYNSVYLRVTLGASRLQEILADRIAALSYGAKNFIDGLTRIIRNDLEFDMQLKQAFESDRKAFLDMRNLYSFPLSDAKTQKEELEEAFAKIISSQSSAFDSHPAPQERFALVEKLVVPDPEDDDTEEVKDLLPALDGLQEDMTAIMQRNVKTRLYEAA